MKREPIKFLRDFLKKNYKADNFCYICGITENIEYHHMHGLSELFNTWRKKNNIPEITTVEQIMKYRILFAKDEEERLSNKYLYSLCKSHHHKLHNLYGQRYTNSKVPKILRWLNIQRDKFIND